MTSSETAPANADMIEYWNGEAGAKWVQNNDELDRMIDPLGRVAMDRAFVIEDERVIDIGCGCGQTTRELARRVGPRGHVTGIDISRPMLALAEQRAKQEKLENITFRRADAQVDPLYEESADVAYSRFGVMFFEDPVAAFSNIRRAMHEDGRLAFVCWRPTTENPWMMAPMGVVAEYVELPAPPPPDAPGPFAFGDADRVRRILDSAGFIDIDIEPHDTDVLIGGGLKADAAVEFLLGLGPVGALLAEADDETRKKVRNAIRDTIKPFETDDGVAMAAATWIVAAHA